LLAWLAPTASGPVATVEVAEPDGAGLPTEDGIVARRVLLRQLDSAEQILKKEMPDRVVVLGSSILPSFVLFTSRGPMRLQTHLPASRKGE
jgi:arginase